MENIEIIDGYANYVISFLDGIVICPSFYLQADGYVGNYLNLDFYKWQKDEQGNIVFFDPFNRKTANFSKASETQWLGKWLNDTVEVKLTGIALQEMQPFNLVNTRWRFRNNAGEVISSELWLSEDGRIRGYSHPNEYSWALTDGTLSFLNENGETTTRFEISSLTGKRKYFSGYLVDSPNIHHTLEFLSGGQKEFLSELHSTSVLGNTDDTLLVIFNGAGTPYDGRDTRWEFFHLPFQHPVDFVRFSESSPVCWYIDKTQRISQILKAVVGNYKKIILIGASAGGFASMYFAESLASQFPSVQFHTVVINPQTTLEIRDRRYLVENFEMPVRPVLPADFLVAQADTQTQDLNKLLNNTNISNVSHNIYFDSGNDCENFFINRLTSRRVNKNPIYINAGHAESGIKIFEMQYAQNQIRNLIINA